MSVRARAPLRARRARPAGTATPSPRGEKRWLVGIAQDRTKLSLLDPDDRMLIDSTRRVFRGSVGVENRANRRDPVDGTVAVLGAAVRTGQLTDQEAVAIVDAMIEAGQYSSQTPNPNRVRLRDLNANNAYR